MTNGSSFQRTDDKNQWINAEEDIALGLLKHISANVFAGESAGNIAN
jgi:hypothetical protein